QRSMILIATNIAAATQIGSPKTIELSHCLPPVRAITSRGTDSVTGTSTGGAAAVTANAHPKTSFRTGLSMLVGLTHKLPDHLPVTTLDFGRIQSAVDLGQWGRAQLLLDRDFLDVFGDERISFLKGLMNRFPMLLSEKSK